MKPPPRVSDPSFFPHQPPTRLETEYRPAVIHNIIAEAGDPIYLTLEVYFLMRRTLDGLSTRRSRGFFRLEVLTETATGIQVPCDNIFLYRNRIGSRFKVEYDQITAITSQLFLPESILASIETDLSKFPDPYRVTYTSDDDEPLRAIHMRLPKYWYTENYVMEMQPCNAADLSGGTEVDFSSTNGWISEMVAVEKVWRIENSDSYNDDSDSDEGDMEFWDWPKAVQRRLSCTLSDNVIRLSANL